MIKLQSGEIQKHRNAGMDTKQKGEKKVLMQLLEGIPIFDNRRGQEEIWLEGRKVC